MTNSLTNLIEQILSTLLEIVNSCKLKVYIYIYIYIYIYTKIKKPKTRCVRVNIKPFTVCGNKGLYKIFRYTAEIKNQLNEMAKQKKMLKSHCQTNI